MEFCPLGPILGAALNGVFVKKNLRILVIEDVAADVLLMNHELRSAGLAFETRRVETRDEFMHELDGFWQERRVGLQG